MLPDCVPSKDLETQWVGKFATSVQIHIIFVSFCSCKYLWVFQELRFVKRCSVVQIVIHIVLLSIFYLMISDVILFLLCSVPASCVPYFMFIDFLFTD
jgi:hypothetical protein